jgi:hypothetical protein
MNTLIKMIVIGLAATLAGCATTKEIPVYVFPDPPANLMVPAKDMQVIPITKKPDAGAPKNATG